MVLPPTRHSRGWTGRGAGGLGQSSRMPWFRPALPVSKRGMEPKVVAPLPCSPADSFPSIWWLVCYCSELRLWLHALLKTPSLLSVTPKTRAALTLSPASRAASSFASGSRDGRRGGAPARVPRARGPGRLRTSVAGGLFFVCSSWCAPLLTRRCCSFSAWLLEYYKVRRTRSHTTTTARDHRVVVVVSRLNGPRGMGACVCDGGGASTESALACFLD
jgi:hypothetical protein